MTCKPPIRDIFQLWQLVSCVKVFPTRLELNGDERYGQVQKNNAKNHRRVLTSGTDPQIWSFNVAVVQARGKLEMYEKSCCFCSLIISISFFPLFSLGPSRTNAPNPLGIQG